MSALKPWCSGQYSSPIWTLIITLLSWVGSIDEMLPILEPASKTSLPGTSPDAVGKARLSRWTGLVAFFW